MKIHKEGFTFLILTALIFIAIIALSLNYLPNWFFNVLLVTCILLFIFLVSFFRNPFRPITEGENYIISPADGKVVVIERVHETRYFDEERLQVSIFMSPLNVHLNRIPVSGKVVYTSYDPGKYLVAWHPKASELNEQTSTVIQTPDKQYILLRQIAGALAKRIVLYLKTDQQVKQGEEMGFIKFGSRVDLFLPLNAKVQVEMNQKVKGGQTIIAELKKQI